MISIVIMDDRIKIKTKITTIGLTLFRFLMSSSLALKKKNQFISRVNFFGIYEFME
jgi:hypothetical protein